MRKRNLNIINAGTSFKYDPIMLHLVSQMKLEKGQFIVLQSNCAEFNEVLWGGVIFYMNDLFPFDEFQYLLDGGFIRAREATLSEKAMCYHTYERTNHSACSLNGIQFYLNYEASH